MNTPLKITTINIRGANGDPHKLSRNMGSLPEAFGEVVVVTETKLPSPSDADAQPLVYSEISSFTQFKNSMLNRNYLTYHSTQSDAASGGCAVLINRRATILSHRAAFNCVAVHAVIHQLEFIIVGVYVNPTLQAFSANTESLQFIFHELDAARLAGIRVFLAGDFNCVVCADDRNSGVADETRPLIEMRTGLLDAWLAAASRNLEFFPLHSGAAAGATFVSGSSWSRIDRIYSNAAPSAVSVFRMLHEADFDHRALCAVFTAPGALPPKSNRTDPAIARSAEFQHRAELAAKLDVRMGRSLAGFLRTLKRVAVACTAKSSAILEADRKSTRLNSSH